MSSRFHFSNSDTDQDVINLVQDRQQVYGSQRSVSDVDPDRQGAVADPQIKLHFGHTRL